MKKENKRKCAICGQPLDFLSSPDTNDVCFEECNNVYCQIPAQHVFWDYPEVEFIGGIHRSQFQLERIVKKKGGYILKRISLV